MLLDPHCLDSPDAGFATRCETAPVRLAIAAEFHFSLDAPTDLLTQFEVATLPDQVVLTSESLLPAGSRATSVPAHGDLGERTWLVADGACTVRYRAEVAITRGVPEFAALPQLALPQLPGAVIEYVFDSRYCHVEPKQAFVQERFGDLSGGARVVAMRDWIAENLSYAPGSSTSHTTARDSFAERRGVCRDYAHVLIAMARASGIPARYASCYAPGVNPPDFHAVAQVFLGDPARPGMGNWHIIDATGMTDGCDCAIIGVGRDAGDVAFLTSFGPTRFDRHRVTVVQQQTEVAI